MTIIFIRTFYLLYVHTRREYSSLGHKKKKRVIPLGQAQEHVPIQKQTSQKLGHNKKLIGTKS